MALLLLIDWSKIFTPDTPLVDIFIRGTLTYLSIFILLRLVLKREAGSVEISDLLVIVLVADAAQNAMAAEYTSFTDGLLLVCTIIFWSFALDWLGYHVKWLGAIILPQPVSLIENGTMKAKNMRRELITREELKSLLREQGIDDISKVKKAYIEGDGHISIIPFDERDRPKKEVKRGAA